MSAYKFAVSIAGSVFGYLFGEWSALFTTLLVLCVIDFLSGILAGTIRGELSSKKGTVGIVRKILMFFVIAVGHQLDVMLGTHAAIRDATLVFYAVNEVISIFENCGRAGMPLPDKVMKAVEVLRESDYKKRGNGDATTERR